MNDQEWKNMQVAERIAGILFVNGQNQQADRLVLTSKDQKDLGGWCQKAIVDIILRELREEI